MGKYSEAFVAFDVAKKKHAVAIAEGGRAGEVRFLGDVENSWLPIERTIKRLADRYERLHVCFEAGPTGYGLYRQIQALGHDCMVVAPALIPKRAGERIKTNRRDAVTLARLHRAGELTGVWAPDAAHEAPTSSVRLRCKSDCAAAGRKAASALAGRSEVRACRAADCLSGKSFLGLVPAESSTGDTIRRKGLTLAGNRQPGPIVTLRAGPQGPALAAEVSGAFRGGS